MISSITKGVSRCRGSSPDRYSLVDGVGMVTLKQIGLASIARGPVVLSTPYVSADAIFTGDADKRVIKLDKNSLKEAWSRKTKLQLRSGCGDVVLLAYYDEMQAWSSSGDVIWKRKTSQNYSRRGNRLYFIEPRLEVVDCTTGVVLDAMDCPEGAPDPVNDDVLLVTDLLNTDPVRAFHLVERKVLWEKNLVTEMRDRYGVDEHGSSIAVEAGGGDRCVLERGGHLFGLSLLDGEFLWKTPVHVPYFGLQVKDGRIYVWTTASAPTHTKVTFDLGSGQVSRQHVAPASGENRFVIVDEATGEILADRSLVQYGEPFRDHQEPQRGTLCQNHVVFTTRSGLMAVFRLSDGELVWHHQHRDQLFYPVFENNRLYVACADGSLVVFAADSGDL
jgi:outer membrane protein assembly factor BamB